jgi:preprotein translocase subunit SecD
MDSQKRKLIVLALFFVGCSQPAAEQIPKNSLAKVEFRLGEREPGEGLTEATVPGTDSKVYLHREAIATNKDIAAVEAAGDESIGYYVRFTFTEEGAKKMERATKNHVDKPLALLADGQLVWRAYLAAVISKKALFELTKKEAERIVASIKAKKQ